jgi:hypothetical protein
MIECIYLLSQKIAGSIDSLYRIGSFEGLYKLIITSRYLFY